MGGLVSIKRYTNPWGPMRLRLKECIEKGRRVESPLAPLEHPNLVVLLRTVPPKHPHNSGTSVTVPVEEKANEEMK